MRNPNGYGAVIKLTGKRRRPFAVRISSIVEQSDGSFKQQYRYLEYFEKRVDAVKYLAAYNSGVEPEKRKEVEKSPTFGDIYDQYIQYRSNLSEDSRSTTRAYAFAFNQFKPLQRQIFASITVDDLQNIFLDRQTMSKSTQSMMITLLHGMYKYALQRRIVDQDVSQFVKLKYKKQEVSIHRTFTDEELKKLWEHQNDEYVYVVLILIYTGMRMSELLELRTENIHLDERFLVGGIKTEAGTNRIIPIAEKIVPLFALHVDNRKEHFLTGKRSRTAMQYGPFTRSIWNGKLKYLVGDHLTHDCRHTCATLMKRAGVNDLYRKKILGHTIADFTDRVYTDVSTQELIDAINMI